VLTLSERLAAARLDPGANAVMMYADEGLDAGETLGGEGGADALVVTEGVTLDVSGEGKGLELADNAVLTVRGAVEARGGEGAQPRAAEYGLALTAQAAAPAVINGAGVIRLVSPGYLLNIGAGKGAVITDTQLDGFGTAEGLSRAAPPAWVRPDEADNTAPLINAAGTGASLELRGAARAAGNVHRGEGVSGGGAAVSGGALFALRGSAAVEGNAVTGTAAEREFTGGGVVAADRGKFTMEGGAAVRGNAVAVNGWYAGGGGVRVSSGGEFVMNGGSVSGNKAVNDSAAPNASAAGGGVSVRNGSFTMEGGAVAGNAVSCAVSARGGGVEAAYRGVFTMAGGTVYGSAGGGASNEMNEAADAGAALWVYGDRESAYSGKAVFGGGGGMVGITPAAPGGVIAAPGSGTDETLIAR